MTMAVSKIELMNNEYFIALILTDNINRSTIGNQVAFTSKNEC